MTNEEATARQFSVAVEPFGTFVFKRRNWALQGRIEAVVDDIFGPDAGRTMARSMLLAVTTLRILIVKAPDGWKVDLVDGDPLDIENNDAVFAVWEALRAAEATFRKGAGGQRADVGAPAPGHDPV